jgi:hypothetical protein
VQVHVPQDADLVIVELASNDRASWPMDTNNARCAMAAGWWQRGDGCSGCEMCSDPRLTIHSFMTSRRAFERLVRKLLNYPHAPAILLL